MRNISIDNVKKLMKRKAAFDFITRLLQEDLERTQGRFIESNRADDTFLTCFELELLAMRMHRTDYTPENAVEMLNRYEKGILYELLIAGKREEYDEALQEYCNSSALMYKYKIQLLNRFREINIPDVVYAYVMD